MGYSKEWQSVHINLDPEVHKQLQRISELRRSGMAALVREAINDWLNEPKQQEAIEQIKAKQPELVSQAA